MSYNPPAQPISWTDSLKPQTVWTDGNNSSTMGSTQPIFKSFFNSTTESNLSTGGAKVGGKDDDDNDENDAVEEVELPVSKESCHESFQNVSHVPVMNGEEGETCELQFRAKLFRLDVKKTKLAEDEAGAEDQKGKTEAINSLLTGINAGSSGGDGSDSSGTSVADDVPSSEKSANSANDNTFENKGQLDISTLEWFEMGTGPVRLLVETDGVERNQEAKFNAKRRITMRREAKVGGTGEYLRYHTLSI